MKKNLLFSTIIKEIECIVDAVDSQRWHTRSRADIISYLAHVQTIFVARDSIAAAERKTRLPLASPIARHRRTLFWPSVLDDKLAAVECWPSPRLCVHALPTRTCRPRLGRHRDNMRIPLEEERADLLSLAPIDRESLKFATASVCPSANAGARLRSSKESDAKLWESQTYSRGPPFESLCQFSSRACVRGIYGRAPVTTSNAWLVNGSRW